MSLIRPARDVLVKSAMHAKHERMRQLNSIEADLMAVEALMHDSQEGESGDEEYELLQQIKNMKALIKAKKLRL